MTPIAVVIPTRYHINMLEALIPSLRDATKIYIYNNGLLPEQLKKLEKYKQLTIVNATHMSIYQMWNHGWTTAQQELPNSHIAILNDDIYFLPGTLSKLSQYLEQNPDIAAICPDYDLGIERGVQDTLELEYVTSTFGHAGLAGFAFMLNGALDIPKIDEHFLWWYGDDDLIKNILNSGYKLAKLRGIPVFHKQGLSSAMDSSIQEKIALDTLYFNKKYNENRRGW